MATDKEREEKLRLDEEAARKEREAAPGQFDERERGEELEANRQRKRELERDQPEVREYTDPERQDPRAGDPVYKGEGPVPEYNPGPHSESDDPDAPDWRPTAVVDPDADRDRDVDPRGLPRPPQGGDPVPAQPRRAAGADKAD